MALLFLLVFMVFYGALFSASHHWLMTGVVFSPTLDLLTLLNCHPKKTTTTVSAAVFNFRFCCRKKVYKHIYFCCCCFFAKAKNSYLIYISAIFTYIVIMHTYILAITSSYVCTFVPTNMYGTCIHTHVCVHHVTQCLEVNQSIS